MRTERKKFFSPLKTVIAAAIAIAAIGGIASAGQLEDGRAAADRGDYGAALQLWRPLAEQGNVFAQHNLGLMYSNGLGVTEDDAEGVRWYRLAADQGHAMSQTNLGSMYGNGEGVQRDDLEAVRWYQLAADQGNASAQFNLGVMYAFGRGVPQEDVSAHLWFSLAAAQGNADALNNRDVTAARMTPDQLAEAQKLAHEWKPK